MNNNMIKKIYVFLPLAIISVVLISVLFIMPITAHAAEVHVYDDGEFFSPGEIDRIENELLKLEATAGADIIIVTSRDLNGKSEKTYLEDYSDELYFNKESISSDAVIMLYGKDRQGRFCEIHGYGSAEKYVTNQRIEKILDEIIPIFQANELEKACIRFSEMSSKYMNLHPAKELFYTQLWFQLIIALIIGAIIVGIMMAGSGGKVTTKNSTYLDSSHSGIVARRDQYIRTSVTKVKRPQQTGSTGGSGGGRSSGGRSHSGGGRRF